METKNEIQKIEKQALNVYVALAAITYVAALSYCYWTKHLAELGIASVAVVILGALIVKTYASFRK